MLLELFPRFISKEQGLLDLSSGSLENSTQIAYFYLTSLEIAVLKASPQEIFVGML